MKFEIFYHPDVIKKDIKKLSREVSLKIKESIETKLATSPEIYGKPLRQSLKNFYKLRVGDYRVVFRIEKNKVHIFYIGHRAEIYDVAKKHLR